MIIYNTFLQYLLSSASAIICLVLVLVQGRDKLKNKTYNAAVVFTSNILGTSLVLCGIYSQEILFNIYNVSLPIRVLDYCLYAFILFGWCNLLCRLACECNQKVSLACFNAGKICSISGAILFSIICFFYMSNTYHIENPTAQKIYTLLEILFALVAVAAIASCTIKAMYGIVISSIRIYVVCSSVFVSLYFLSQIFMTSGLGIVEVPVWNTHCPDFSGWLLFAVNSLTIYFVYKKDFQQLYTKDNNVHPVNSVENTINTIAEEHHLTLREKEIAELAYRGNSNAQIAESLCISLYTVKTHMKNIFEKTGISSRMELTYLVNQCFYNLSDKDALPQQNRAD